MRIVKAKVPVAAILAEQGSLNPAMSGQTPGATRNGVECLPAHGRVGVAIHEI
jgi:hypothetical protein